MLDPLLYRDEGRSQELFLVREDIGEDVYVLEYDPGPVPKEDTLLLVS